MLEYRVRRLPEALRAGRAQGRRGRPVPVGVGRSGWTSPRPRARPAPAQSCRSAPVQLEEHIVADVAWAACCYIDWTGDHEFAAGPGRELLVETARYWASRIELDETGRGHIRGVIGPDEYHEPVDDNAFTNVMARWNLRRAAAAGAAIRAMSASAAAGCDSPTHRRRLRPRDRHLRAVRRLHGSSRC